MAGFRSDKRLYVNADRTKVVEEGSPEAAYLLVGAGGTVTEDVAAKYNLRAPKEEAPKDAKQEAPPENKAKTMPRSSG